MRYPRLLLLALATTSLSLSAQQVYKTTDAQGNTVFTDVPPAADAETVDLQAPNIADSVEVRPPAQEEAAPSPAPAEQPPSELQHSQATSDDLREDLGEAKRKQEMHERVGDAVGAPERPPVAKPAPARPRPAGGR